MFCKKGSIMLSITCTRLAVFHTFSFSIMTKTMHKLLKFEVYKVFRLVFPQYWELRNDTCSLHRGLNQLYLYAVGNSESLF